MEKVGIAVVGALILIILIVGWANRGAREDERDRRDAGAQGTELQSNLDKRDGNDPFEPIKDDGTEIDDLDDEEDDVEPVNTDEGEIVDPGPTVEPVVKDDVVVPTPEPRPTRSEHVLKSGETLSHLAQKYLGKASLWREIVDANPGLDPARLRIGAKIVIPERAPLDGVAPASDSSRRAPRGERPAFIPDGYANAYLTTGGTKRADGPVGPNQYRVKKGDTLGGIAQKTLGSSRHAAKIFAANKALMKNPDRLRVGWVLQIPGID